MAWPWHRSRSTSMRKCEAMASLLLDAPAVAHLGWPLQLDHHLRVVVAIGVGGLRHFEFVLPQQNREDGLDLHGGERRADAAVPARAERNPGPAVRGVGLLRFVVAVRIEGVGIRE